MTVEKKSKKRELGVPAIGEKSEKTKRVASLTSVFKDHAALYKESAGDTRSKKSTGAKPGSVEADDGVPDVGKKARKTVVRETLPLRIAKIVNVDGDGSNGPSLIILNKISQLSDPPLDSSASVPVPYDITEMAAMLRWIKEHGEDIVNAKLGRICIVRVHWEGIVEPKVSYTVV